MKYDEVPNIITGKDLDYLSDMCNELSEKIPANRKAANW